MLQLGPFSNNYKKAIKALKELHIQNSLMISLRTSYKRAKSIIESDTQDEKVKSDT